MRWGETEAAPWGRGLGVVTPCLKRCPSQLPGAAIWGAAAWETGKKTLKSISALPEIPLGSHFPHLDGGKAWSCLEMLM